MWYDWLLQDDKPALEKKFILSLPTSYSQVSSWRGLVQDSATLGTPKQKTNSSQEVGGYPSVVPGWETARRHSWGEREGQVQTCWEVKAAGSAGHGGCGSHWPSVVRAPITCRSPWRLRAQSELVVSQYLGLWSCLPDLCGLLLVGTKRSETSSSPFPPALLISSGILSRGLYWIFLDFWLTETVR
jgi:hypothetical protein